MFYIYIYILFSHTQQGSPVSPRKFEHQVKEGTGAASLLRPPLSSHGFPPAGAAPHCSDCTGQQCVVKDCRGAAKLRKLPHWDFEPWHHVPGGRGINGAGFLCCVRCCGIMCSGLWWWLDRTFLSFCVMFGYVRECFVSQCTLQACDQWLQQPMQPLIFLFGTCFYARCSLCICRCSREVTSLLCAYFPEQYFCFTWVHTELWQLMNNVSMVEALKKNNQFYLLLILFVIC